MKNSDYEGNEITIKEVAELANVSVATAARVMGNYGSVSEKTRKKVLAVSEKLNYVPNQIAQSMKSKSTKTVGVVVGNIKNTFFGEMLHTIERCLQKHGFNIIMCNTNEDPDVEMSAIKMLHSKYIDGLIIATCQPSNRQFDQHEKKLYSSRIPTVFIDREIFSIAELCVKTDHFGGAYEATDYLIKNGHRRIGVIAGDCISTMEQRISGYEAALKDNQIAFDKNLICFSQRNDSIQDTTAATKRFLEKNKDITAIFALNNLLSTGALIALKEMQYDIPREISFIGWDDFPLATILEPPISVITQDMDKIASVAAEKLLLMIEAKENWRSAIEEKRITFRTNFIERASCAALSDSI